MDVCSRLSQCSLPCASSSFHVLSPSLLLELFLSGTLQEPMISSRRWLFLASIVHLCILVDMQEGS